MKDKKLAELLENIDNIGNSELVQYISSPYGKSLTQFEKKCGILMEKYIESISKEEWNKAIDAVQDFMDGNAIMGYHISRLKK